jgi:hypothetical protein
MPKPYKKPKYIAYYRTPFSWPILQEYRKNIGLVNLVCAKNLEKIHNK